MDWQQVVIVVVTGLVTGFINTVAGGGSTLSLPVLMIIGLPANVANGTNRIGILLQSLIGVGTFRNNHLLSFSDGWRLTVPSAAGSLAGALVAVRLDPELMRWFIVAVMVAMLILVIFKPEIWIQNRVENVTARKRNFQTAIFFLIGFYGGFVQVGVGFLLLAGLVLGCGHNLVRANGLKLLIILVFTLIALIVFWTNNQVHLWIGLLLGAGSMVGAWIGARFTIMGGAAYVRYFLIFAMAAMILKLAGLF